METLTVKEIFEKNQDYFGKEILIEGWIKTVRSSKSFGFIELNDGSYFKNIQVVFDESLNNFAEICKFSLSSNPKSPLHEDISITSKSSLASLFFNVKIVLSFLFEDKDE